MVEVHPKIPTFESVWLDNDTISHHVYELTMVSVPIYLTHFIHIMGFMGVRKLFGLIPFDFNVFSHSHFVEQVFVMCDRCVKHLFER